MKRKIQIILGDEAWTNLESITKEANENFVNGNIAFSDVVNEVLLGARLDIRSLQAKHTNIRKSLRLMAAQKEIDIDAAIRALTELKLKSAKRSGKPASAITTEG